LVVVVAEHQVAEDMQAVVAVAVAVLAQFLITALLLE
jgi:hypothetical protein